MNTDKVQQPGNVFGVAADGTHHELFGNWKRLLDGELTSNYS
jgi:hypothetical protein